MNPIANELGKIAVQKLSELTLDDAREAAKAISRVSAGGVLAGSGLGVFGAGLVVGAGLAVLFAPASGRETRARLRRAMQSGWAKLSGRASSERQVVVVRQDDVSVN